MIARSNSVRIPWFEILVFPAALLAAVLAKYFFLTEMFLEGPRIWIHEFGHALSAWLCSRPATPLGIGWTNVDPTRSLFTYVCFAFLLGLALSKAVQLKSFGVAGFLAVLLILQNFFTWTLNDVQFQIAMVFGGVGGELYLGAILMEAFFAKFSPKVRWDFFRYPVLLMGAYAFVQTALLWWKISKHQASIPFGTLWGGESDGGGDMNRLMDEFGWTKLEIIRMYVRTAWLSGLGLLVAYFTIIAQAISRDAAEEDPRGFRRRGP